MNNLVKLNYSNCKVKNVFTSPLKDKIVFVVGILLTLLTTCTAKYSNEVNFDYLVFSQRWLPTSCIAFEERNSSTDSSCVLPSNYDMWAIHGLWPTQYSHMGPFFCNSTLKFDLKQLEPILDDLKSKWMNIEGGKSVTSLWKHEWMKHGTCFAELYLQNSEFIYFNTTLHFYKTLNLFEMLKEIEVEPSNEIGYDIVKIFNGIRNVIGKAPYIDCVKEVKTKQALLAEIRVCYSNNLELIDCETVDENFWKEVKKFKKFTNCPLDSSVLLPLSPNFSTFKTEIMNEKLHKIHLYNKLIKIFHLLKLLIWATI